MSSSSASKKPARQNVFVRGASPAAIATAQAASSGSDTVSVRDFTLRAIATADTLEALASTISARYRRPLMTHLRKMLDVNSKLAQATTSLASLEEHKSSGTFPSQINGMHNPFAAINPVAECRTSLGSKFSEATTWFNLQKAEALQRFIDLKRLEVTELEKLGAPEYTRDLILAWLDEDWVSLCRDLGKFTESPSVKGIFPTNMGDIGKTVPTLFKDDLALAKELTHAWVAKIWDFVRIKKQKSSSLLEKKKDLAAAATTPMEIDPPSVDKLVKDAVAQAMKGLSLQPKRQAGKGNGKPPPKKANQAKKPAPRGISKKSGNASSTSKKRPRVASGVNSGPQGKKGRKN